MDALQRVTLESVIKDITWDLLYDCKNYGNDDAGIERMQLEAVQKIMAAIDRANEK